MEAADVPLLLHAREAESNARKAAGESFVGLRTNALRTLLFAAVSVLTLGLGYLVRLCATLPIAPPVSHFSASPQLARWYLPLRVKLQYYVCSLREADAVLITETAPLVGEPGQTLVEVQSSHDPRRVFLHKGLIYAFDPDTERFENHVYSVNGKPFSMLHELGRSLTAEKRQLNLTLFGRNEMAVPEPSIVDLVLEEVLSPFYVFQIVSITIWMLQFYWVYSLCIFVLATAGIVVWREMECAFLVGF